MKHLAIICELNLLNFTSSKMFYFRNCACAFFAVFLCSFVRAILINPENYVDKIAEDMVACMEHKKFFDKKFPVTDCETTVNAERYGQKAIGKVEFKSGFVVSIDSAMIPKTSYRAVCGNTKSSIDVDFKLCGINIVYDVHYELEDNKKGDATFLFRYDDVFFKMSVGREHKGIVEGSINYFGTNSGGRGQWDLSIKTHPTTPQDQLIAHDIRSNSTVRKPIVEGFTKWNEPLQKCLNETLPKFEYPGINYLE